MNIIKFENSNVSVEIILIYFIFFFYLPITSLLIDTTKRTSLILYENQKFRPESGPFVYISNFFEGVNDKFFGFMYV